MNYLELLEESYQRELQWSPVSSKLEFLAYAVFDFITYETQVSSLMAKKALEVCKAISSEETFEYQSNKEDNLWYLIMANMPFFIGKIECGSSIRWAWWGYEIDYFIDTYDLFYKGEQLQGLTMSRAQWIEFIDAMIEFVNE